MDVKQAYKAWADIYDNNDNKTRDLEKIALIDNLKDYRFDSCLEIGCGTGKNSEWLITRSKQLTGVDLSEEMLAKARSKINADKMQFLQADINDDWIFVQNQFDIIIFSLVLEHIENLDKIFSNACKSLKQNGIIYVGELHPFKQYSGSKARFETEDGEQIVSCFNHHISDFISSAKKFGLEIFHMDEYFDNDDRTTIPRILTILFRKN